MSEIEDQLRAYADHVEGSVGAIPATRRGRPRLPLLILAAAVALVIAGGVWLTNRAVESSDPADDVDVVEPPSSTTSTPPSTTSIPEAQEVDIRGPAPDIAFDPGPLSPRHDVLLLRTPSSVIVWGGDVEASNIGRLDLADAQFDDGAIFDVETGEWRTMSPSPLPAVDRTPFGFWLGDRAFIARAGEATFYDPGTDAWTTIDEPPITFETVVHLPEREEIVALGPDGMAVLSLPSATWRLVDSPGDGGADVAAWDRSLAWTGDVLLSTVMPDLFGDRLVVDAWDPATDEWSLLSEHQLGPTEQAFGAAWTGSELLVVGYDMHVAAFDPASTTWRELPPLPIEFQEGSPTVHVLADGRVVVERFPGIGVLSPDETWTVVPGLSRLGVLAGHAVDGAEGFWAFGVGQEIGTGNAFSLRSVDLLVSRPEVLIGFAVLALVPGDEVVEMGIDIGDFGSERPWATVRIGSQACTISAIPPFFSSVTDNELSVGRSRLRPDCDPDLDIGILADRLSPAFEVLEPQAVEVPEIVGLFADSARQVLENADLQPVIEFVPVEFGTADVGRVMSQSPDAGRSVPAASVVTIVIGEAVEPDS